ncbi:MAG: hypothetical protein ACKOPQ_07095 [Novosphingobium sp.]
MRHRATALLAALFLASPASAASPDPSQGEAQARAVITRSKTTRTTYALYTWTTIRLKGAEPVEEWSAEFNSGPFHRVETPRDRVVADCARKTAAHLSLASGTVTADAATANTACGIAYDETVHRAAWLGKFASPWGEVDRVRLWGLGLVRTYDVTANGLIVACHFADSDKPDRALLELRTVAIERTLPKGKIFTRASLSRSVMPEKFTRPPAPSR